MERGEMKGEERGGRWGGEEGDDRGVLESRENNIKIIITKDFGD